MLEPSGSGEVIWLESTVTLVFTFPVRPTLFTPAASRLLGTSLTFFIECLDHNAADTRLAVACALEMGCTALQGGRVSPDGRFLFRFAFPLPYWAFCICYRKSRHCKIFTTRNVHRTSTHAFSDCLACCCTGASTALVASNCVIEHQMLRSENATPLPCARRHFSLQRRAKTWYCLKVSWHTKQRHVAIQTEDRLHEGLRMVSITTILFLVAGCSTLSNWTEAKLKKASGQPIRVERC